MACAAWAMSFECDCGADHRLWWSAQQRADDKNRSSAPRAKKGGYVNTRALPKGPDGRTLCRWCALEVPKGRRSFCSDACVHEWKLRTDPGYLREQVFRRDCGICAACGTDTESLRRDLRKLDYAARRVFLRKWRLTERGRR